MNPTPEQAKPNGNVPPPIDETLRLIAHASPPEGLESRVHAALRSAPRRSRVLAWPASSNCSPASWAGQGWVRAAAAAAIVCVVAGGGWGVYLRVQRPAPKAIVIPLAQPAPGGGFSSAGAKRTPQTVKGPVVVTHAPAALKAPAKKKKPEPVPTVHAAHPTPAEQSSAAAAGK